MLPSIWSLLYGGGGWSWYKHSFTKLVPYRLEESERSDEILFTKYSVPVIMLPNIDGLLYGGPPPAALCQAVRYVKLADGQDYVKLNVLPGSWIMSSWLLVD